MLLRREGPTLIYADRTWRRQAGSTHNSSYREMNCQTRESKPHEDDVGVGVVKGDVVVVKGDVVVVKGDVGVVKGDVVMVVVNSDVVVVNSDVGVVMMKGDVGVVLHGEG